MGRIKTLLVIVISALLSLKIADFCLGFRNNSDQLTSGQRHIVLREHDPNQNINTMPNNAYMVTADGLVQREYKVSTDQNGFIKNGNTPSLSASNTLIVFMGGSTTEAIFVDERNRFPSVVEQNLRDTFSPSVAVINAGVSGNNSFHSLLNLQAKVINLKPDFVVLMHNMNDFALLSKTGSYWVGPESRLVVIDPKRRKEFSSVDIFRQIKNLLFPNIYDYVKPRLFPQIVFGDEFSAYRGVDLTLYKHEINTMFESSLKSFIAVSREWGIKPILMTQFNRVNLEDAMFRDFVTRSNFPHEGKDYVEIYENLNQIIRNVAKDMAVHLIDLDKKVPKSREYIYDIVHLNDNGSKFVGNIITEELKFLLKENKIMN